jgi:hypothetical protein
MIIDGLKSLYMRILKKYLLKIDGAVLPMVAIAMPVLVGSVGIGVDFGLWLKQKRELQTAVDAAALSAAYEASKGYVDFMEAAARRESLNNGYNPENAQEFIITYDNDNGVVDVSILHPANFWLASFFVDEPFVRANASAEVSAPEGDFCILSLDTTASGAISTDGTANISQPDCGMAANSRSSTSLQLNGTADIEIGDVAIRGGMDIDGSSTFTYNSLWENMPMVSDPYADLEIPDFTPCNQGSMRTTTRVNSDTTLSPGVYCGGINISGNNDITFEPGVYIIDGGDLSAIGNGTIYADGVSFILTNSGGTDYGNYGQLDISGGREVFLSAPDEGYEMEGIAVYQDRNAPDLTSVGNKLTGTTRITVDGAIYFPSQGFELGGNDITGTETCTRLIANTVSLVGTPNLGNSCEGTGVRDFAPPEVRLIF